MKADWRWITALVVCIGLVIGAALWVTRTPDEPAPAPVAEVPAPLPPATGIDGDGPAVAPHEAQPDGLPADPEQLPADVQAQPDAGSPAVVLPGDGTGGEVFVRSPAFRARNGSTPVSATHPAPCMVPGTLASTVARRSLLRRMA